jgi:flavin reductase (DIM6/NTAB) family NADH-FMN oxidoreductase RutF
MATNPTRMKPGDDWAESDMFELGGYGNKPFTIRIPALLVSRGLDGRSNFLTAMWFTPAGDEPSRMIVAIMKETFTYGLVRDTGEFVMSVPSAAMMDVIVFAGRISGRDVDKWKETGLTPVKPTKVSVPLIGEALSNVEYRVIGQMPLDDTMDLFVGEVVAVHVRKGAMEGQLYREDSEPLLYMGTKYDEDGKSLGKHYTRFSGINSASYDSPLLKKYITRK